MTAASAGIDPTALAPEVLPRLPELDPALSRWIRTTDRRGDHHTWHLLDNGPQLQAAGTEIIGTVLCVHGNPTWSYLWRNVIDQAPAGWRVIALDQLGMGFSDRTDRPRTLAERVDDLGDLSDALGLAGPVVLLAHDWGGPIGLGWALAHTDLLAGIVLTNTAVHQPASSPAPTAIRIARSPLLLDLVCRRTPAFVRATTAISRPPLRRELRDAFAAPYDSASRRRAVADFVADIPLADEHRSMAALQAIGNGLDKVADLPALLVWGPSDPVFSQLYLDDLMQRLPQADVHRFAGASHLVLEDRPEGIGFIWQWITTHLADDRVRDDHEPAERTAGDHRVVDHDNGEAADDRPDHDRSPGDDHVDDHARAAAAQVGGVPIVVDVTDPGGTAIVELGDRPTSITFGDLAERVSAVARGLTARGVEPGDRVAVLVPPGIDLTTVVYALWRLGAVIVIADAGLGLRRMAGALRGAGVDHVVGIGKALVLTGLTGVPGSRIRFEGRRIAELIEDGTGVELPDSEPAPDADGAILFTSGATGPPKGVVYSRTRLSAQIALLRDGFGFGHDDSFVAAFAPFALYGPALGMASAVPDMDVTAPHTLTAAALAEAVERADATIVFVSPAALRNVVATAAALSPKQRTALQRPELVLSAGAPVPPALLRQVKQLLPQAATHTPYGMTEALPVATIDPTTLEPVPGSPSGVCVGTPLPAVTVALNPLGAAPEDLTTDPGVVGEIVIFGPHTKTRYDRLWGTQVASECPPGWHRSGDVGCYDADGRLWVQGRVAHVLWTADGPLTPYGPEELIEQLPGVSAAAVVGVGPVGTQQPVAVIVPNGRVPRRSPLVPARVAQTVREAAGVDFAAVLEADWLPVDIRHASKVDRSALARWATRWLHGKDAARALKPRTGSAPVTRSR
ncbi:alpha/beta fold hydrolase [Naumannella halotolerans]|uniref:Acyl-CoA synthetase (AMP-forming)/AMP-acid ligase II n=1 Tax=Naumannella halotolerans TaxID=993414 RepID=A0A4R7IYI9_9ACTN|nr:alpha/beta fold hydrolase [Naumannella halotolerans]TDT29126.1 acyl-CoA synthetase (AMP-forming)/AMP-acid ligase II [Naumannella halotolerans]